MSEAAPVSGAPLWRIDTWYPNLTQDVRDWLRVYFDELIKFNRTINLISPKTVVMADAIHFSDSISGGLPILAEVPKGSTIYDFGSGNGFPGLVLAIISPAHKFVLIDSDQRKCEFLKHMITRLGLTNCEVKNATLESLEANSVVYAVTRGFANISKTILLARKSFQHNGILYHFKSEQWSNEVATIPTQLCSVWAPALLQDYKLPIGPFKFAIIKTTKISK